MGPSPLAIDGAALGHGLPPRLIPLDQLRALLLDRSTNFPATDAGNQQLWCWAAGFGTLVAAGVEGTGSYGHPPSTGPGHVATLVVDDRYRTSSRTATCGNPITHHVAGPGCPSTQIRLDTPRRDAAALPPSSDKYANVISMA